jgi:hypothetical protein
MIFRLRNFMCAFHASEHSYKCLRAACSLVTPLDQSLLLSCLGAKLYCANSVIRCNVTRIVSIGSNTTPTCLITVFHRLDCKTNSRSPGLLLVKRPLNGVTLPAYWS